MNDITKKRLHDAGWDLDRKISINIFKQKYNEIGLEMPSAVEEFLTNFGILKIDAPDKKYFDTEFNPLKAIGINLDGDYFRECLVEYGINKKVYPIGIACRKNLIVLMTEENEFYCFTDGCLVKAGNNVEDMLDSLVGECKDVEIIE